MASEKITDLPIAVAVNLADIMVVVQGGVTKQAPVSLLPEAAGVDWSAVENKPTTISGYGITDGVTTARSISTGTGLSGGGNLSADRTLSLANTAVVPATVGSTTKAPILTVDQQGRITAASEATVTPAFASLTGKPTTLAGYGITDGVTNARTITAGTGLSGGGDLSANRTLALADTVVSPGTYTNATLTVDQQGRMTAASSGSAGTDFQAPIVAANYYPPRVAITNLWSAVPNILSCTPIWFPTTITWTKLAAVIKTADAGKHFRLGIYANNASNLPGSRLVDTGSLSTTSTGLVTASISQQLTANTLYWLVSLTDSSAAQFVGAGVYPNADYFGAEFFYITGSSDPVNQLSTTAYYGSRTFAYGTLPDPFGSFNDTASTMICPLLRQT